MVVDQNDPDYVVCEYCGTKYKINEKVKVEIGLDDDLKGALKFGQDSVKEIGKFAKIVPIIAFVIFFAIFIIFSVVIVKQFKGVNNHFGNNANDQGKISSFEVNAFNSSYELYNGTQSKFMVEPLLDQVVTNNKRNSRKINVVYGDMETNVPDEIITLKHDLKDSNYEVVLNYDDDGFVNEIELRNVN